MTYPGVKGNFLRFQLQSPINRTGNTWHIQIAAPFSLEGLPTVGTLTRSLPMTVSRSLSNLCWIPVRGACLPEVWKFGIVVVRSSSMHLYQLCPTFVRWNALTGKV